MMTNCWKLGQPETYSGKKAWANEDNKNKFNYNGNNVSKGFKKTSPFAVD